MDNVKSSYELVIIIKANLGDEATAALVTKFKNLISANGTLEAIDEWGKRRLAYPINDEPEGYYAQLNFTSVKDFPAELDRQLKITDGIIRSLIINKDSKNYKDSKNSKAIKEVKEVNEVKEINEIKEV